MTGAASTVAYEATPVSNIVDWGQKFDAKIKTLVKGANKIVNKLEAVTTRLASFNKGLAKASQFLETQLGEDQAWEGATVRPEKFDKSNSWPQDDAYAEDQVWEGATEKPEKFDKSNSWPQDETPRTICFDDTVEWMEDELEDYGPSRADEREWWSVLKQDIDEIHCLILESEPFESNDDFSFKADAWGSDVIDFSFDYSGSDVIDCSFGDGATLTAGRRPSTTSRGVSTFKTPHTAVASDLLHVRDELSDESSLTKVKVTAGPAKVRTLGTFLAELLDREEFLCCWRQATEESIRR